MSRRRWDHEWISAWRFDLTLRRYQAGLRLRADTAGKLAIKR